MNRSVGGASLKRVSIVVPCFNAAPYLGEALESVLAQHIDNLEIVIVNDGSTDGSAAVAQEYARRYPQIRVLSQSNQGISAARNRGIAAVTGDVIGFLDADDTLPENSLAARLSVFTMNAAVQVAVGLVAQFVSPDVDDVTRRRITIADTPSRGRVVGAMLVRRSVFDVVGFFDDTFRLGETIDWVARADAAGILMQSVDAVVLRRRIHSANSVRKAAQLRSDYLRVLRASIRRQRTAENP